MAADLVMPTKYIDTVKKVVTQPTQFFKSMPTTGGYVHPTIFLLINSAIGWVISMLFYGVFKGPFRAAGADFFGVLVMLPMVIIGVLIAAVIFHILAKLLGGKGKFEGSYRAICYVSVTSIVNGILVVGFLAALYGFYLGVLGFKGVHKYSTGKAVATLLIPVGLLMFLGMIAAAIGGLALFKSG